MRGVDLLAPAHRLLDALACGELSSVELTRATLARITQLNPVLNAVVSQNEARALEQAEASDARRRRGEAGPLEGLPMTIKDAFDVAGFATSCGTPTYRERYPEEDAVAVRRLRQAGAVLIGKTNVPPFCGDFQTANALHGVTRNPWDVACTPGGSSGGAAVAVATGMSALELGSDLGGSIRWPAHACGLFGLKTSWGLVPTWGHIPPLPERRPARNVDVMVSGPIARTAADLDRMLRVVAGPRYRRCPSLAMPRRKHPQGLRVALWLDDPFAPVDAVVRDGVLLAVSALKDAGAIVDPHARPAFAFAEAFEVFALLHHFVVAGSLPSRIRARLQAHARGLSPQDASHAALQARGAALTPGAYVQVLARQARLRRLWAAFFQKWDVVLCPPAPVRAFAHDATPDPHERRIFVDGSERPYFDLMLWASLASGAGLPAACAPIPPRDGGLPTGVQILAGLGEDLTATAVAGMIEALLGGVHLPPILAQADVA